MSLGPLVRSTVGPIVQTPSSKEFGSIEPSGKSKATLAAADESADSFANKLRRILNDLDLVEFPLGLDGLAVGSALGLVQGHGYMPSRP